MLLKGWLNELPNSMFNMFGLGQLPWEHGPLAFIAGETDELFHTNVIDPVEAARM